MPQPTDFDSTNWLQPLPTICFFLSAHIINAHVAAIFFLFAAATSLMNFIYWCGSISEGKKPLYKCLKFYLNQVYILMAAWNWKRNVGSEISESNIFKNKK